MEIVIQGHTYAIGKMEVETQFHVARRLAPVVYAMSAGLLERLRAGESLSSADNMTSMLTAIEPMVSVISSMSDADSSFVLNHCLAVCQRRTGEGAGAGYQKVRVDGAKTMQFSDIDLLVMLHLVAATIRDNLGNFLHALIELLEVATSPAD